MTFTIFQPICSPPFLQICYIFARSKFVQIHFFVQCGHSLWTGLWWEEGKAKRPVANGCLQALSPLSLPFPCYFLPKQRACSQASVANNVASVCAGLYIVNKITLNQPSVRIPFVREAQYGNNKSSGAFQMAKKRFWRWQHRNRKHRHLRQSSRRTLHFAVTSRWPDTSDSRADEFMIPSWCTCHAWKFVSGSRFLLETAR